LDIARPHAQIRSYRDYLEEQIQRRVPEVIVHGKEADRLDNTSYIAFRHIRSAELMTSLPQLALSSGSACASGLLDPSHVLKAMGVNDDDAFSSIRISPSKFTERDEVDRAVEDLIQTVYNVRQLSPIWKLFLDGLID